MDEHSAAGPDRESGFGVVEVIVSMVLLGIIALAFLPLVARSAQATATTSQVAVASRLVSKQMELLHAAPPTSCPTLGPEPLGVASSETLEGPRGVRLQTWTKFVGPCSASGTVGFVVTVTPATDTTDVLATASTLVLVGAP